MLTDKERVEEFERGAREMKAQIEDKFRSLYQFGPMVACGVALSTVQQTSLPAYYPKAEPTKPTTDIADVPPGPFEAADPEPPPPMPENVEVGGLYGGKERKKR
jgi:hypothetical protein